VEYHESKGRERLYDFKVLKKLVKNLAFAYLIVKELQQLWYCVLFKRSKVGNLCVHCWITQKIQKWSMASIQRSPPHSITRVLSVTEFDFGVDAQVYSLGYPQSGWQPSGMQCSAKKNPTVIIIA